MCNSYWKPNRIAYGLLALVTIACNAFAQPLDDVGLEFTDKGVVATIRLTGPVQYVSHFPQSHGKTLEVFYNRVEGATTNETWVDNEVRKSPPSGLIPSFTVTTRDQQTKPKLVIEFSREAEYSVAAGKDNRSLQITILPIKRQASSEELPLLPTVKPEAATPTGTLTADQALQADTNKQAHALMVQGRDALAAKNNDAAMDAFNKLLLLPPNDYTQDAQEWVGVARERAGQIDKAKIEYDLYLRLYPEGAGAARVAQRMEGLSGVSKGPAIVVAGEERKKEGRWMSFGSLSSRYYYGHSKIDSTFTFNNATTTSSLSLTDQSMLITSVDASERYVSDETDARLVFRDLSTLNFQNTKGSSNRVYAAYGEIKSRTKDYMVRLGRQSSMGGGVLGRFDGISGGYGDAQDMRVNAVAGALNDFSKGSKPVFAGASVDKGPLSFYAISQRVEGATDRRALGTEYRYYEGNKTAFGLLDYDTYFKAVNAAQFMGTIGAMGGTLNFMVDRRKAPSLSIRNALNGAGTSSINDLQQAMSATALRDLALARTATSRMGQIGLTVPYASKWQVGGNFRLSNTTGLAASGTTTLEGIFLGMPSRGTEKSVTGQVIGSGLYKDGDIWSGSLTLNTSSVTNGYSVFFYNHTMLQNNWTLDTSLQLSSQKDQFNGKTTRTSPMVRGAYRLREQIYFDVDGGLDLSNYSGPTQTNKITRYFFSGGFRWDF